MPGCGYTSWLAAAHSFHFTSYAPAMKTLLTILLFLTGLGAHAQASDWTFLLPVADLNGVMAIATGPDGSSYITGRFVGSLVLGATTLRSTAPGQCLYVAKCSPTGQVLRATLLEGATSVLPRAITVDAAGNCYVTGSFRGTLSYNQGQHTTAQTMAPGGTDIFLLRCGPGGRVRWVSQATGGTSASSCTGIGVATDCAGNSYITGSANGDNLRFGNQTFGARRFQGFVASYDAAGQLRWARVWDNPAPGFSSSPGGAVAVDNAGNCYVSGTSLRGWTLDGITLLSPNNTVFLAVLAPAGCSGPWPHLAKATAGPWPSTSAAMCTWVAAFRARWLSGRLA
jgi:Beta-propeller repeat